jgi:hypothetical protein
MKCRLVARTERVTLNLAIMGELMSNPRRLAGREARAFQPRSPLADPHRPERRDLER